MGRRGRGDERNRLYDAPLYRVKCTKGNGDELLATFRRERRNREGERKCGRGEEEEKEEEEPRKEFHGARIDLSSSALGPFPNFRSAGNPMQTHLHPWLVFGSSADYRGGESEKVR